MIPSHNLSRFSPTCICCCRSLRLCSSLRFTWCANSCVNTPTWCISRTSIRFIPPCWPSSWPPRPPFMPAFSCSRPTCGGTSISIPRSILSPFRPFWPSSFRRFGRCSSWEWQLSTTFSTNCPSPRPSSTPAV